MPTPKTLAQHNADNMTDDVDLLFAESAFAEVDADNIPTLNDMVTVKQQAAKTSTTPDTLTNIDNRVEQIQQETFEAVDIPVLTEIAEFPLISDAPEATAQATQAADPIAEALEAQVQAQLPAVQEALDYAARRIIAELVEKHADSIRNELQSRLLAMRDSVLINVQKRPR